MFYTHQIPLVLDYVKVKAARKITCTGQVAHSVGLECIPYTKFFATRMVSRTRGIVGIQEKIVLELILKIIIIFIQLQLGWNPVAEWNPVAKYWRAIHDR